MRRDSATAHILAHLPATPVLTLSTVTRMFDVSKQAASRALEELHAAGILDARTAGRGKRVFTATSLLDLITSTERRLASTRFDTRDSAPVRPVPTSPARPAHPGRSERT